jgi:oligoribonuclease
MRAIFLDIEATGLDPIKHRTIDIGFKIVDITENQVLATFQSIVKQSPEAWAMRDPASIDVNGFSWELIIQGKPPDEIGREIIQLFSEWKIERGNAVFICQNPAFDRGFFSQLIDVYTQEKLFWPYHWLDFASMYWALAVQKNKAMQQKFPEKLNLSKNAIAQENNLPPEETPHRAIKGVEHLIQCYEAVLNVKFH